MGGLDDLVDDVNKEQEQEEVNSIKDDLGVESKKELEQMDDRVQRLVERMDIYDKELEKLKKRMSLLENAVINNSESNTNNKIFEDDDGLNW